MLSSTPERGGEEEGAAVQLGHMLTNVVHASDLLFMLVNDVNHVSVDMLGPISTYGCIFTCY